MKSDELLSPLLPGVFSVRVEAVAEAEGGKIFLLLLQEGGHPALHRLLRIIEVNGTQVHERLCHVVPPFADPAEGAFLCHSGRRDGKGFYFGIMAGASSRIFYLSEAGETEELPAPGRSLTDVLCAGAVVLAREPGSASIWQLEGNAWQLCHEAPGGEVTNLLVGGQHVWFTQSGIEEGFSLWSGRVREGEKIVWNQILGEGAGRYALNRMVSAACFYAGHLYLGTAASSPWLQRYGKHGHELLRVAEDGSWEIVCGQLRFTRDGFKLPLSLLGPGFGRDDATALVDLSASDAGLLAAVNGLADGAGVRQMSSSLWYSRDGEEWEMVLNLSHASSRIKSACQIGSDIAVCMEAMPGTDAEVGSISVQRLRSPLFLQAEQ